MKKIRILALIIISIYSAIVCSKTPTWINEPDKMCKKSELCAVGEGTGLLMATSSARSEISKIFESKISSKFQITSSETGGSNDQSITSEINEVTENVLSGIEVKKRYEDNDSFYVLVVLNKYKASKTIKKDIDKIDSEMKTFEKENTVRAARKLEKLYHKRESLNAKYSFLKGSGLPPVVNYQKIFDKIKLAIKNVKIYVSLSGNNSEELEALVVTGLTDLNYSVLTTTNDGATHKVSGGITSEKLYLKVKGFMKFKFNLSLNASSSDGVKKGALNHSVVVVGKDMAQISQRAILLIKKYMKDNIIELNFD